MLTEKFPSMRHQTEGRAKARGKAAFAYLMEMGTGKSKTVIDEAAELWDEGTIDLLVVFAGKGSYADWEAEHLPLHLPDEVPRYVYTWTNQTSQAEQRLRTHLLSILAPPGTRGRWPHLPVLCMNVEALGSSRRAQDFLISVVTGRRVMVVVDESAAIRNWQSQRTKFLVRYVKPHAVARRGLTGTPVLRSPTDLWGLYMFLGPHLLRQNSFFGFRARYCITKEMNMGTHKVVKEVGVRNIGELAEILRESSHRVLKEDCLDLPPKIYQLRGVEMTDEQVEHYNSLIRSGIAMVDSGEMVSAKNVMTQIVRAHQVLCGYLVDDERNVHPVPHHRTETLMEVVEEAGSASCLVWFAYRRCLADIADALRTAYGSASVVEYHGSTPQDERALALRRLEDGSARFFLSTLHTGFRGIKATAATTTIYHSNTNDLEHRLQSEDRNHRIGQRSTVNYVDLFCRGTVEEKIIYALRRKLDIALAVQSDGPKAWLIPAGGRR